jgi:hypothetical protein
MNGGALTGIEQMSSDKSSNNSLIYGLDGVRRTAPQRGLNIIEGKKVVR